MTPSTSARLRDLDLRPQRPPVLPVERPADVAAWAAEHRDALRDVLAEHGSVLVRGLGLADAAQTGAVLQRLASAPVDEREAFAPREAHGGGLHSATPWPPHQPMCMHHEMSYVLDPPSLMLFACLSAPAEGGATAVADATAVLRALPPEIVDRFEREGWMLVRSYTEEIGASYAEAFGTDDRAAVERYCRANAIEWEWQADGGLRTRQRRPAVVRHPVTGERCWFNQIAFLSEWTLEEEVREFLVDVYGPDGLPFTTRFGDGEPVPQEVVEQLNAVYEQATAREPWRDGDLLLVDNIRTAHSREPFTGAREVLVGLADPVHLTGAPDVRTDR